MRFVPKQERQKSVSFGKPGGVRSVGAIALILMVLLAIPGWSQSSNGSVRGTVQDPTSAVIPNVTVVLTNTATGIELKTVSNGAGIYVFPSVIPGPYKITADLAGMNKSRPTCRCRRRSPPL